jgi:hypothetical protein
MTIDKLREEIRIELQMLEIVVQEVVQLANTTQNRDVTMVEKTAASAFLAQFYTGIENILKRISKHYKIPLPKNESWHIELFNRFCTPSYAPLPALFDDALKLDLSAFRKFRHVVHHGYGFQIDWDRLVHGIENIEDVYFRFKSRVLDDWRKLS